MHNAMTSLLELREPFSRPVVEIYYVFCRDPVNRVRYPGLETILAQILGQLCELRLNPDFTPSNASTVSSRCTSQFHSRRGTRSDLALHSQIRRRRRGLHGFPLHGR